MLLIRSLVFDLFLYGLMFVMGVLMAPLAAVSRAGTYWVIHTYTSIVLGALRVICGLRVEVRGKVPQDEVIVASKHESFLDILILANVLPRPKFVMKKQLKWAPVLGFYAMRMGCAPVDRGRKREAMTQMVSDLDDAGQEPGQIIIYPQGTRTLPGAKLPYKIGAGVLYTRFGHPCVPAANQCGCVLAASHGLATAGDRGGGVSGAHRGGAVGARGDGSDGRAHRGCDRPAARRSEGRARPARRMIRALSRATSIPSR